MAQAPAPAFTLSPADGKTLYAGQILTLTATLTNAATNIRPEDTVTFTLDLSSLAPLYPPPPSGSPNTITVPFAASGSKDGTASLDIVVASDVTRASVEGVTTSVLAVPPIGVQNYTVKEAALKLRTGPDKTYIPFAPNDFASPQDAAHTATMTATVVDAESGLGLVGYYVHWREGQATGLFDELRCFDNPTGTAITPIPDPILGDNALMVRTKTDNDGKATLYLVTQSYRPERALYNTVNVMAQYLGTEPLGPILCCNPIHATFPQAPLPEGLAGEVLDYEKIPGNDIPVRVPLNYRDGSPTDDIYLFLNGQAYDIFSRGSETGYHLSQFPKVAGYSDKGPFSGMNNQLSYVVGSLDNGQANVSAVTTFKGKGDRGDNTPDPQVYSGPLIELKFKDGENYINRKMTIPSLIVNISLNQPAWTAVVGDKITLKLFLNGYYKNAPRHGLAPSPFTAYEVTAADITNRIATITVAGSFLAYYDRLTRPLTTGKFYAVYDVEKASDHTILHSVIFSGDLDTTSPYFE